MEFLEWENKYKNVPLELKNLKRWVCFKVEEIENGKTTKRPYNPLNGTRAKVNDNLTWSTFNIALMGVVKYNFDGIGFIFGDGYFGVDLDNHPDENGELAMTLEDFDKLSNEFINALNSYSEKSQSGLGVHIICQGKLPEGSRRKKGSPVEMYEKGRFFAFTGNAIKNVPIRNCEQEIKPLWEKYLYTPHNNTKTFEEKFINLTLSDEELIEKATNSSVGEKFYEYYYNGNTALNNGDSSSADFSFCQLLAFWCNGNKEQIDRIFRNSGLMRSKWDERRGESTYGEITINKAIETTSRGYNPNFKPSVNFTVEHPNYKPKELTDEYLKMNLNEKNEPIFRIKKIFKKYSYNDTGNAMRFYDYFGDLFKYNVTDKIFMFWTGKTWIRDTTDILRKYANKFLEILKEEEEEIAKEISEAENGGDLLKVKSLTKVYEACCKNRSRVSNKAGKDAMISEFKSLYDIPIQSMEFNKNNYLLNTDSGIVNLEDGSISPWDKSQLLSQNTKTKVSFEEPVVWNKFVHSIFDNGNEKETQELVDSLQTCLGYSLSGATKEQVMFILYGKGSNGKSTLTEFITYLLGDYASSINSDLLVSSNKSANTNGTFSLAKLQATRFLETGETDDGGAFNEAKVKLLTGGDLISAQYKFGNEFEFKPKFKIWLSTNNKPFIKGRDDGIWRRIFMFPFLRSFKDKEKDKDLPEKLKKEADRILGWCIKGYLKYKELGDLFRPDAVKKIIDEYKKETDYVAQFIENECVLGENHKINCKELYAAYKEWAKDNGMNSTREGKFFETLIEKGIQIKVSSGKKTYVGIDLNTNLFCINGE